MHDKNSLVSRLIGGKGGKATPRNWATVDKPLEVSLSFNSLRHIL